MPAPRAASVRCADTRSGATSRDRHPPRSSSRRRGIPAKAHPLSRRGQGDPAGLRLSPKRDAMSPLFARRSLPAALALPAAVAGCPPPHRQARSPYEATITIERWLRSAGGFGYDERPPAPAGDAAARRLPRALEARLLPAVRGVDGVDAPLPRDSRSGRGRVHERDVEGRHLDGDRPRRACVGRGLVRRSRLAHLRSDAGTRHVVGDVHECVRLGRCNPGARHRTVSRRRLVRTDDAEAWRGDPRVATSTGVPWRLIVPPPLSRPLLLGLALLKSGVRWRRARTDDPRRRAAAARAELAAFVRDQGSRCRRRPRSTSSRLELRARGVGTDAFAAAFARARYGPPAALRSLQTRRAGSWRRILSLLRTGSGRGGGSVAS